MSSYLIVILEKLKLKFSNQALDRQRDKGKTLCPKSVDMRHENAW